MSVTTTDNARITTLRHVLGGESSHRQPTDEEAGAAPAPNQQNEIAAGTPEGWETEWRRVPAYRPAQDQRGEDRDTYNNAIERNFVRVMFGGVYAMAVGISDMLLVDARLIDAEENKSSLEKHWRSHQPGLFCVQDWWGVVDMPRCIIMLQRTTTSQSWPPWSRYHALVIMLPRTRQTQRPHHIYLSE